MRADWTPDGNTLVFAQDILDKPYDIWTMTREGMTWRATPLVRGSSIKRESALRLTLESMDGPAYPTRPVLRSILAGCAPMKRPNQTTSPMLFLTRDGCVLTGTMRARLDGALRSFGRPLTYQVIDVDTLPPSDIRRADGTPTVLVGNHDLFGLPEPPQAADSPT